MVSLKELEGVLNLMQRYGVRAVETEGLRVEMHPPMIELSTLEQKAWGNEELCSCGHPVDSHNEHGCLVGPCDVERCTA